MTTGLQTYSRYECMELPVDEIRQMNTWWVQMIKQYDQNYLMAIMKNPELDFDRWLKYNPDYDCLKFQFQWTEMSGSDRMKEKFKYISHPRPVDRDDFNDYNDSYGQKYEDDDSSGWDC